MDVSATNILPPGFRFDPTDEELLLYFLYRKIASLPPCNSTVAIPVLHHLHSSDPWDLTPEEAVLSENKWYFFRRGAEEKWGTKSGQWEDLHMNEPIVSSSAGNNIIGMKKYFVFFKKQVPTHVQTNWIMEQYHLSPQSILTQPEWVLCRVQQSNISCDSQGNCDDDVELSALDEVFLALDDDLDDEINFPY